MSSLSSDLARELERAPDPVASEAAAQRLRLRRSLMGLLAYAGSAVLVLVSWALGFLNGSHVLVFLALVALLNGVVFTLILTGLNQRLADPSLTGVQVLASIPPVIHVMYHLPEPVVRVAFLLLGLVTMLFAVMRFDFRGTLGISAVMLASYLLLLTALWQVMPERMQLRAEALVVLAYAITLALVCYLGDYITGLRHRLKRRNEELEEALQRLHELATRDALTQLPNRRTVMELLGREASRSDRRKPDADMLCVCMLDVDHFKQVNDRFGHQVGDAVLQQLARAFRQALRTGDVVARFGGEEFLLVLPESSSEGARAAVERLRAALAAMDVPEIGDLAPITVSIGLAMHRPGDSIDTTISRADTALYRAKGQGRDRVVVAD